ncbi:invasion associated locus B family protein [Pseudoruegeria sp. SK021]|uniref:invasion associated locus B family protein n=1 Tax=Pseudoruegeria sp. SK021 TaxID=1933035 RepID=UPI000A22A904|nr:invasion associated locus B family protein [Pseudoruegeria sp. SK021]OSP55236.1 hypothetical protein BV911_08375 [Pseudoruegeria sp. SK021]
MSRLPAALLLSGILCAVALPASAQDTTPDAAPVDQPAAAPAEAPVAAGPRSRDDVQPGETYGGDSFTDWVNRCIRVDDAPDPCEIHQTLMDAQGTRTAEINIFPLDRPGIAAGASIITPLETLLTRNLTLSIDGAEARVYPYTFCSQIGCVAQIGLSAEELAAFRGGKEAKITIVPVAAPNQQVTVNVSLAGFTAGFNSLSK